MIKVWSKIPTYNYIFYLLMITFWSEFVAAEEYFPSCDRTPTFEVLPFIFPKNSDYGVFMADRFVVDLM